MKLTFNSDTKLKPYYQDEWVTIYHGDCRDVLFHLSGKFTAVVTDPPYELGFMGKSWDSKGVSFQPKTWETIRKYCLPGAPLLSFGGSRTQHRISCAIEDGGWEIRDTLMWVYGSGFPKSLDISKAIDKSKGVKREVIGYQSNVYPDSDNWGKESNLSNGFHKQYVAGEPKEVKHGQTPIERPATPEATLWSGYGTALKPAYEPIILGMNPLAGTFANNALKYGVAGLNIDGCRIPTIEVNGRPKRIVHDFRDDVEYHPNSLAGRVDGSLKSSKAVGSTELGRFPANFLHDGSEDVMELFPESKGWSSQSHSKFNPYGGNSYNSSQTQREGQYEGYNDNGSAARFFYCAKASKSERGEDNNHPTVKPLALMEYLCKLVKMPENNLLLDPFMGSGTTLLACAKLGIKSIGMDSDERSCEIAAKRCSQQVFDLR